MNTLPIRWSKTGPHSAPRSLVQGVQQQENANVNRSGYYSDAEDVRGGQQRRVLTLIRPSGQPQPLRMPQHLPNLSLLKSGGSASGLFLFVFK
jgi:hypothetical protein